jgi:hypothetical protein
MSSLVPDTDNFFKYLLTVGVLMVLFGLIYPLKQEQGLRTKLIEIKEQDSLLRIEVEFLELQVNDLDTLKNRTQQKVDELKRKKIKASKIEQVSLDERILLLVDNFDNKRNAGLSTAKEAKLKQAKLKFEQKRYDETNKQIKQYFLFKTFFWWVGFALMLAGLFFWMDSTYYDELVKVQGQAFYRSKYALCVSYVYTTTQRFKWIFGFLLAILVAIILYVFVFKTDN